LVFAAMPRTYLALASHRGSGEHRCDQRRRHKFQFNHTASPFDMKGQQRLVPSVQMVK
jgi:hypothetical protein